MSRACSALVVAMVAFVFTSGAAFAQVGQGVDFTKLSVNKVMVGDTVDAIKQTLGPPRSVKGSRGQYMVYGNFTIQLTSDLKNAAFLRNGSRLALDGKQILASGDAASRCDGMLNMKHRARQGPDGAEYCYYQPQTQRELVVLVYRGVIRGFVLGSK